MDAYYKQAKNLIDEGQFGAPIILTAFNYAGAQVNGIELTATYERGPWSFYGNLAYSRAIGKNIVSSQFNFSPDDLAYISQHTTGAERTRTSDLRRAQSVSRSEAERRRRERHRATIGHIECHGREV